VDKSILVKTLGFPATLIHGDPTVLDRWLWLRRRLPPTRNRERLAEFGCGTGAFSIGAALRGYHVTGASWDERNQSVATERAALCGAEHCRFEVVDLRKLDEREDWRDTFDVAIACEVIEHVLDDRKLMTDMAACLKPGGRLLLTTPNLEYVPLAPEHMGPFAEVEDGGHVRRGYSPAMLEELCDLAGLAGPRITFCSGLVSQKVTALQGRLGRLHPLLAWGATLPLRALPPLADAALTGATRWPPYSICLEAYKPRFLR
jgi:SAM-dependent methyltransferase